MQQVMESPEQTIRRLQRELKQKDSKKRISAKRTKTEHAAIRRIKRRGIMTDPYDGTVKEFHEELIVCTGLANFHLLWDAKKKRPSLGY